ncbi:Protein phosphatase inhibitor 2 (IPP-2) [Phaffia rhodozyma]|uniref:Protein phosphatase inhibitor 2 (IPP-2) n=1 Tax=Phaffia rhodozyma TaxID=264483 RepID=A0A0F7SVJ8_PHARH|nr:Protein phosphatase inhibitor 2 (IPP-2) [Phaffia rhodozyma]
MNSEPDQYSLNAPPLIPLDSSPVSNRPTPELPPQRPKGILKNVTPSTSFRGTSDFVDGSPTVGQEENVTMSDGQGTHLKWDEENLAMTEAAKDSQMKITEPKTPYVRYDAENDLVLSDVPGFDLSTVNGQSQSGLTATGDLESFALNGSGPTSPPRSNRTSSFNSSRSTSFSLPPSDYPHLPKADGASAGESGEIEEEDMTPEQEEKHKEFVKARLRHYSNEGEAMRKMKEAMQANGEEEEDEEEDSGMAVDESQVNGALGLQPSPEDVGLDEVQLANEGRGGY